ncbi:energy transducer TonB [Pelagicoccus sp. SDUM812002]|uniref:energy transducer TonB n=1 Tax=Pelagicoccus sp. SDUM812002 TaxID=3041266 RepID=UPI00280CA333|nr:energy transducer TonB [Pelagicoccus sp. SDUM812002]MDQ8188112.1 energy transducer TonB [Pelagicoccus sp. SDUM812002]
MSHIYAQEPLSAGFSLRALSLGALGVTAIFALLPVLMEIPNPFHPPAVTTPEPTVTEIPTFDLDDPPEVPIDDKTIEKPVIEEPPPPITIEMMAMLLNPSDNGTGVTVDAGRTFLGGDDTNIREFLVSELDQRPRALVATQPLYPYSMQQTKTRGEVMVEFVIDEHGRIIRPRILKSTHREFEQAALDAVMKSKWQPGRKDGKEVRTIVHLPVNFVP